MASMTDQTFVDLLLTNLFKTSTATVITGGTGGSVQTVTPPFFLRLMSAQGSNTSNGTEQANGNGYTTLGATLGSVFAGTIAAGAFANANAVSWTAVTSAWSPSTQTAIEVWDSSGTKLRYLQGALTASITGVAPGDTVTFAIGAITVSAATW